MIDSTAIGGHLADVRERIADAAVRSGRSPGAARLVIATKTQPPEAIAAAYAAGARDFGENYVQEAVAKRAELRDLSGATWHLIGHLQSNKARIAVATFDLIQTLDRASLAAALDRIQAERKISVLIEVNIGGEVSKSGVKPEVTEALINTARERVDILGLMTVPPPSLTESAARRWFAALRELRNRVAAATGLTLPELSMGMTDDFAWAIAEGATMVRIGRAVFGERAPRA